jgi:soluble lytic murein transglycosylase-like protein
MPTFSQDRPRFFDNFDTVKGVNVVRPDFVPVAAKPKPTPAARNTRGRNAVQRTAQTTPVAAPQRAMNPSEGLANRDLYQNAGYTPVRMATNSGLRGFSTGNTTIDSFIVESGARYGVDPMLVYAVMHQESSFKVGATSHKGASGLMQLMPATARRLGVTNIYDPKQNIDGGVKYLRMLLNMFNGDVVLALAGYNAGEGAVMRYGNNVPPFRETQEYVRRITARYNQMTDGSFARNARRVPVTEVAKLENKETRPLTVYEPAPVAVRLADGRMRLVNQ